MREQSKRDGLITDEELAKMEASIQKDFGNLKGEKASEAIPETKELKADLQTVNDLQELLGKALLQRRMCRKCIPYNRKRKRSV